MDNKKIKELLNNEEFVKATELVLTENRISEVLLQRKLSCGYEKAVEYLSAMEEMGIIIYRHQGVGSNVLMTKEQFHKYLSENK